MASACCPVQCILTLVILVGVYSVQPTAGFKSSYNLEDEVPGHSVNGDHLPSVGDTTRVYIDLNNTKTSTKHRRFMRFTTCPECRFRVTSLSAFSYPKCLWKGIFNDFDGRRCAPGCTYLQLYDQDYINDTGRSYEISGWQPFYTYSSKIYVVACYNDTPVQRVYFNLNLTVVEKSQLLRGSAYDTGSGRLTYITSPTFPNNYVQNQETYKYVIQAVNYNEYIELSFDDWNLAPQSIIQFENSDPEGPFYGSSHRPIVRSVGTEMIIKFHTGKASTSSIREFMGFKATYTVIESKIQPERPITDCGGYLYSRPGGVVTLETKMSTRELYDCVWVLKRHPDYSMIYVKLIDFKTSPTYYKEDSNHLSIRGGVTSLGKSYADVSHTNVDENLRQGFENNTGFYLRLRGKYQDSLDFVIAFASYRYGNCRYHEFKCLNSRCISSRLRCDGYDHCGDNSDEVCSSSNDDYSRYSYTISIGVIIPMVISVFLIVVICLLIIFIRRCRTLNPRNARQPISSVSGNMARRNRRGRNRSRIRMNLTIQQDSPPSYDEVVRNTPIGYLNMAFMWSQPDVNTGMVNPPTYEEATSPTTASSQNVLNQSSESSSSSDSLESRPHVRPPALDSSSEDSRLDMSLHQSSFSSDSTMPDRDNYSTYDSRQRSSIGSGDYENQNARGKVVRDEFIECPVSSSALGDKNASTTGESGAKENGAVASPSREHVAQSGAGTSHDTSSRERVKKKKRRRSNSNSQSNDHEMSLSPSLDRPRDVNAANEHSNIPNDSVHSEHGSPQRQSSNSDEQNACFYSNNSPDREEEVVLRIPSRVTSPSRVPVPAPRARNSLEGRRASENEENRLHGTYLSLSLDTDDREADIFV